MKKSREQGNVIEIGIVVVLLVAIIGLVTWRFVEGGTKNTSNSQSQSQQSTASSSQAATDAKLIQGSINEGFGTKLAFSYPDTWKKESKLVGLPLDVNNAYASETITLTSPSGKYVVVYIVNAGGGLGGACLPEAQSTYTWFTREELPGFAGVSYLEATITPDVQPDGGTRSGWQLTLLQTTAAKNIAPGASVCDAYLKDIIELSSKNNIQIFSAGIKNIKGVNDADTFRSALSGQEYEAAKAILLSTAH